jgi:hypothetical protein
MRYENPMYMAEDAGAADLISGGRLPRYDGAPYPIRFPLPAGHSRNDASHQ